MGGDGGQSPMRGEVRRLADALSRLVREHFDLARAELKADAGRLGRDAAVAAVGLPFLGAGFFLLQLALAALVARALGVPGALAVVGAANLALGGGLALLAVRRFRRDRAGALPRTAGELRRDREALVALRTPVEAASPPTGLAPVERRPPAS
jgi:uncharacterized membrane protein YqjE